MTTLEIKDQFTINDTDSFKKNFEAIISESSYISIKLTNIFNIDISAIQLIKAVKDECNNNKKNCNIELSADIQIKQLLINAGFSKLFNIEQ
jgi:anti-anti-sigma regulatory factor